MIGSCNCLITGVRLQPTVRFHCPITTLQINKSKVNKAIYAPITFEEIVIVMISNSNWTEWSTIQGVIARVISKSDERDPRGRFEITSTITP